MSTSAGNVDQVIELYSGPVQSLGDTLHSWRIEGVTVRHVRGEKCTTVEDMWSEFAAALQFPLYVGQNWAAFDECLSGLDWLPPAPFVLAITHGEKVLTGDDPAELDVLVRCLRGAVDFYGQPIEAGEWFDRPAIDLRVIVHSEQGSIELTRSHWEANGAEFRVLELT